MRSTTAIMRNFIYQLRSCLGLDYENGGYALVFLAMLLVWGGLILS